MKKITVLMLAALLSVGVLAGCGSSANAPAVASSASAAPEASQASESSQAEAPSESALPEKLVVGLDASFPPMGFTDQNNQIIGVDIDLAKAVCEKLGIEFEAKPIEWAAKEMELETGKITVIWNGMTITPDRQEAWAVSRPYMSNDQVIVVNADSGINSKADLAGKLVAAQSDSSGLSALQKDEIYAQIKDGVAKEYPDYVTALGDLEFGRCDAIVMDSVVANYYITQNAKAMTILDDKLAAEDYGIAAKKGNEALIEAIEGALSELAAEGKIAEISETWFGRPDAFTTY